MFGAIKYDSDDGGNLPKAKSSASSNVCFTTGFRLSSAGLLACDPYPEWKHSMRLIVLKNGCNLEMMLLKRGGLFRSLGEPIGYNRSACLVTMSFHLCY